MPELPELVPELLAPPSSPEPIALPVVPPQAAESARGTAARQAKTKAFFMVVSRGARTLLEESVAAEATRSGYRRLSTPTT